jgi:NAD(P)-dependent dehydrogenase (short-subunit alcohol dehydrogenase family)
MDHSEVLKNKVIVITGATSGIGFTAAREFAARGAYVLGVGRSAARCSQAESTIQALFPMAQVRYLVADLSSQAQVRRLAAEIGQQLATAGHNGLDVLINNAGTYSGKFTLTEDGFELTFAVNHLAPFLLTHELLPLLKTCGSGRVLTVSSGSHYNTWLDIVRVNQPVPYIGLWAYKVSKLANVLFTLGFNRRMANQGVRAFAVDPGLVNTEIGLKNTDWMTRLVWQMRMDSGTPAEVPVQSLLHLAIADVQNSEYTYWYNSQPKSPSRQAQRVDLADSLWEASCKMCSLPA